jgi:excisionase family DNA binding protein
MPTIPKSQGQRYDILTAHLLRQQADVAKLYSERLLSVREVSHVLGGIGLGTVRRYCHTGVLPVVRVGKGWMRIPASAVRALLGNGEKP